MKAKEQPEKKTAAKKTAKRAKAPKAPAVKHINLVKNDSWLEPYEAAIQGRHDYAVRKIAELTGGKNKLADFADGHLYYGLHRTPRQWVIREWAPNATAIYLIGDFNGWKEEAHYAFKRIEGTGNWELNRPS